MTFTTGDPNGTYPSTSVRNHPFEGPEVFDDTPAETEAEILAGLEPHPNIAAAVRNLFRDRHGTD